MNNQAVKSTSTPRVIKHRAGLTAYMRELRAEVAELRRDVAMLVEAVQPEPQKDPRHGR
jgi:hypothetical protein